MKLKNAFLIAALALTSCGHVRALEAQVVDLETQVTQLTNDKYDFCGAVQEAQTFGMVSYVGEGLFFINSQGKEFQVEFEEFKKNCDTGLEGYQEELARRKTMLEAVRKANEEITKQPVPDVVEPLADEADVPENATDKVDNVDEVDEAVECEGGPDGCHPDADERVDDDADVLVIEDED